MLAQTQGRRRFHIVANQTRKPGEGRAVRQQLQQVIDRYVNPALEAPVRLELLGEIPADAAVRDVCSAASCFCRACGNSSRDRAGSHRDQLLA